MQKTTGEGIEPVQRTPATAQIEQLRRAVSEFYSVPVADLIGRRRDHGVMLPRQVAMFLARRAGASLPQIGQAFGRHHRSVLHAIAKIERLLQIDPAFRRVIVQLQSEGETAPTTSDRPRVALVTAAPSLGR